PFLEAIRAVGVDPATRLIATGPGQAFFQSLKVCFLTGFLVVSPYVLWQMWGFIAAGLYPHEKKAVSAFFPVSILLFWLGVIAAFKILIPFGLRFLISWGEQYDIDTMYTIEDYISTCLKMVLGMGFVFQLPIVMLFLQATGMVSRESFKKGWRVAVLGSVIAGMFLTDPSPITQLMMAIPVVGLYFVGIWGGRFVGETKEAFRWWKAWPLVIGFALYVAMLVYSNELNDMFSKVFNADNKPPAQAPEDGGTGTPPGSGG
ncbi:MAG: twin-arginine translocase subunit TatC, partial [bacterium]|nr:twin-arginine translocase subunit TatC [bacterium]